MLPRQKLVSAAYAIRASSADQAENTTQLGGQPAAAYASQIGLNAVQTSLTALSDSLAPVATAGLPADLADGDNDLLASMACSNGQVVQNNSGSWSCVDAPPGPSGPQGPQGLEGEDGEDGEDGATGAQGAQGPQGEDGSTGAQGAQGPQGPTGPQGDTGAAGADGPQGPPGISGYQIMTNSMTSNGHFTVAVFCGSPKKVISGGCNQGTGSNRALINSNPIGDIGWECRGRDIGTLQTVTLTAYAICANVQ
jgi:hypothetical protein